MRMNRVLFYSASAATGIAGIIHLYLTSQVIEHATNIGIFFLIAGILQIFWILPTIRIWDNKWRYLGIVGTAALIIIWGITRFPNPIIGRALSINELGIIEETLQTIFIALTITSLATGKK